MPHKSDTTTGWLDRIAPVPNIVWWDEGMRTWHDPRRVIYDHELLLFGGVGHVEIEFDNSSLRLEGNSFVIIPPGRWHVGRKNGPGKILVAWMHFDWQAKPTRPETPILTYSPNAPLRHLFRRAPSYVPQKLLHGTIRHPVAVFDLHERLRQRFNYGTTLGRLTSRGLALELLLNLLVPEETANGLPVPLPVVQQMRLALQHLAQMEFRRAPAVRDFIQKRYGRSHDHLARLFKKAYGIAPLNFVNALRIARAKELLRDTGLNIKEIADRLGYDDPVYFGRLFQKQTGKTPKTYRDAGSSDSPSRSSSAPFSFPD